MSDFKWLRSCSDTGAKVEIPVEWRRTSDPATGPWGTPPYKYVNNRDGREVIKVLLPCDAESLGWGPQALASWALLASGDQDDGRGHVVFAADRNTVCNLGDDIAWSMSPSWWPEQHGGEAYEGEVPGFVARFKRPGEKF